MRAGNRSWDVGGGPGRVSASNFGYIAMNLCPKSETKESAAPQYGVKFHDVGSNIGFSIRTEDIFLLTYE